jgi:hypothetical protein
MWNNHLIYLVIVTNFQSKHFISNNLIHLVESILYRPRLTNRVICTQTIETDYSKPNLTTILVTYVLDISSGDLLIWRNFEFWSTNICYCLLSAPQNQFKTEKKRVWLVNVFCWRFIFSVKKEEDKYSYFKIRNFVKLANHRMTYIQH